MVQKWLSWALPLLLAGLAVLGAVSSGDGSSGALAGPFGALLFLFGAALPIVLRWTPVEPSVLKLGLFACLLSPPLLTLLWLVLGSWSTVLWVIAGLQLIGLGCTWRIERPGRAGWFALVLCLLVAAWQASVLLLGGWEPRLGGDVQIWNAVAADMLGLGRLENPVLAGEPFPSHPGFAALVAAVADGFGRSTPQAAVLLTIWAAATLPLSAMLLAGPLSGEVKHVMLTPLVVLLCCSSGLGLLHAWGQGGELSLDPALEIAASSVALALSAGAWLAAAHALRHGKSPWVGLFACMGGAAALVAPSLGLWTLGAPALAALVRPGTPSVRRDVPLAALAAGLPGLWLARRFGVAVLPFEVAGDHWPLVGFLPLFALGFYGLRGLRRPACIQAGALHVLLVSGVLLPLPWALLGSDSGAVRLSGLALAPLVAGGALRALGRPLLAPLAIAILLGGVWDASLRFRSQALSAAAPFQLREDGGVVEPAFPSEAELAGDGLLPLDILSSPLAIDRALLIRRRHRSEAYRWIREHRGDLGPDPVLLRSLAGSGDRGAGPVRMHLAGLFTGLPLWCDDDQALSGGSPRWEPRRERVRGLFEALGLFDPNTLLELGQLGRSAVFLVEEADREATYRGTYKPFRGVDVELERLGARRVHVGGTVSVYHWSL